MKGYVNIDLPLPEAFLAKDRPDLVKINKTDWEHYYKNHVGRNTFLRGDFQHKENVCDVFADIRALPFMYGTVDEILAVQVFEHFTFLEGRKLLEYWVSLLKPKGIIHIDVPDLEGSIGIYHSDPVWGTRLLYGSQKNEYGIHKSMYTKETLTKLFEEVGLKYITLQPNMHTYPAFGIIGRKA
jgi:predicted SAM-dependent methyltransferase